jgi:transcriptional regulator of acetoin/glycerol metabolism
MKYHWPGNAREIKTLLEYVLGKFKDESIKPSHLSLSFLKVLMCFSEDGIVNQKSGN